MRHRFCLEIVVNYDPVAQLDRVSVSEAGGHEFESHRDHQCESGEIGRRASFRC